jgi:hypothetical protein
VRRVGFIYSISLQISRIGRVTELSGTQIHPSCCSGVSPSHLSRLFKAQTGVSISRFRNQQRLQRFQLLYGHGRRTTALAAAVEAGFGSYAQLHRVFRELTGRSPSALRTTAADDDLGLPTAHPTERVECPQRQ